MRQLLLFICCILMMPWASAQKYPGFREGEPASLTTARGHLHQMHQSRQLTEMHDLDSTVTFLFEPGYWERNRKMIFDFEDTLLQSQVQQFWENDEWVNNDLDLFTYNQFGNLVGDLWQEWANETWMNSGNTTITYNEDQLISEYVIAFWTDEWLNYSRFATFYDDNNNPVGYETSTWSNDQWEADTWQLNTYDEENRIIQSIFQLVYDFEYINTRKITYTYNDEGVLLYSLNHDWSNGNWEVISRGGHSYNMDGQLLTDTSYTFDGNNWTPVSLYELEYNSGGYQTLFEGSIYTMDAFQPTFRLETTYTPDNLVNTEVYRSFDAVSQSWINGDSTQYYYNETSSIQYASTIPGLSVFPNPASEELYINIPDAYTISGPVTIVSAADGKHVFTQSLTKGNINTSTLVPGTYILFMTIDGQRIPIRFSKQ